MRATNKRVWLVVLGLAMYAAILVIPRTSQPAAAEPAVSDEVGSQPTATMTATNVVKPRAPLPAKQAPAAVAAPSPASEAERAIEEEALENPDLLLPYDRTAPRSLNEQDLAIRADERRMLDQRWAAQSTDTAWSASMTTKVQQALIDQQLPEGAARTVDCRKTICRLELATAGGENALKLIDAARSLHNETWVDHHEGEGDAWTLEVFVSHPEYRLSGDGGKI
jgi:hypothetical protein